MAAASCSSSIPPAVRIVEQCRVSLSGDGLQLAPRGEVSLPLTFFDVFWLGNYDPVQRLFFYRWPDLTTPHFVASALPRLKRSLSLALRLYYPLAGCLRPSPPGCCSDDDKPHIYCTDGDSVSFALSECVDAEYFHQLAGDHARWVVAFRPLVPEIPMKADGGGSSALMALQVTVFPGAGVCVGVSIHHAACDGSGFTSFLRTWAFACRSEEDTAPLDREAPLIDRDRTLVSDPDDLYTIFHDCTKRLFTQGLPMIAVDVPVAVRSTFLLRRARIEELRRRVTEQRPPPPPLRYSSFVLTCAYVWVCWLKVGEQPPPQVAGDAAHLIFAVDCRGRLRPPLPATYFGNCLGFCFVDARRSDLVGKGGVGRAVEAIAESVARLGKDGEVLRGAVEWIPKMLERLPGRPLSIAGSPRFGVYSVDFGWGRPAKVEVVGIERTGSMALAERREEEGGVEVGMALPVPEMAKFSSLFEAALDF